MAYNAGVRFEWDPAKAEANFRKHGVAFEEARTLFTGGGDCLILPDDEHGGTEENP